MKTRKHLSLQQECECREIVRRLFMCEINAALRGRTGGLQLQVCGGAVNLIRSGSLHLLARCPFPETAFAFSVKYLQNGTLSGAPLSVRTLYTPLGRILPRT